MCPARLVASAFATVRPASWTGTCGSSVGQPSRRRRSEVARSPDHQPNTFSHSSSRIHQLVMHARYCTPSASTLSSDALREPRRVQIAPAFLAIPDAERNDDRHLAELEAVLHGVEPLDDRRQLREELREVRDADTSRASRVADVARRSRQRPRVNGGCRRARRTRVAA